MKLCHLGPTPGITQLSGSVISSGRFAFRVTIFVMFCKCFQSLRGMVKYNVSLWSPQKIFNVTFR